MQYGRAVLDADGGLIEFGNALGTEPLADGLPGWATITSRWLGWKGLRKSTTALCSA